MSDWVFDSLICFLHSPSWNAAIQSFLEEKSIIFDPNVEIDISDQQYTQIHNEYKNLVDFMLGNFLQELSITPEEFEIACMEGKNLSLLSRDDPGDANSFSFHNGLFQQIWAANDIRIFVRLMKQRNLEIQIQALDLIERRQASQASQDGEVSDENNKTGDLSKDNSIEKALEEEIEKSVVSETVVVSSGSNIETEVDDIDDKFKRLNLFFEQEKARIADSVASRQEYLRLQRDKILQIKKQARARQLYETNDRPKSAVAAQKIIDGEKIEAEKDVEKVRKMLAKKLRDEVVDNNAMGHSETAKEET